MSEYTSALPWPKAPSKCFSQPCTSTLPKSQEPSHYTSLQLTFTLTSAQTSLRCTSLQITFAMPLSPIYQHIPSHRHDQKCPKNAPHSSTLAHCLNHTSHISAVINISEYTFALPWSKVPSKYSSYHCTSTLPESQTPSHYTSLQPTFTLSSAQTPLRYTSLQLTFALHLSPLYPHIPS